jgi:hypothetical protein
MIAFLAGVVIFISRFFILRLHQVDEVRMVSFLNRQFPDMEQSTDLLLRDPADLTLLQQIQKEKARLQFEKIYPTIVLPHHIGQSLLIFAGGSLAAFVLSAFSHTIPFVSSVNSNKESAASLNKTIPVKLPATVKKMEIRVNPPDYTHLPSYSSDARLSVPEGSEVSWKIIFTDQVDHVTMIFSRGDSTKVARINDQNYGLTKTIVESTLYQLTWKTSSGESRNSDYYRIEVAHDRAPEIAVHQLQQFTEVTLNDNLAFNLKSTLSDEYGVKDAYIIATVSKGSGESVKFREEKLLFTSPEKIQSRSLQASRTIDLPKLGLEPGDELYFYIEALDNKAPSANRTRTETFFIALQDTASQNLAMEAGLGVDLMPEYFRSQRQIIIDSEKLLRVRKSISKQEFNSRSNELGYDQKVLRLKYGEFLGEEFESAIGPGADIPVEDDHDHADGEEEEDPSKKFGHIHDKDNEHNLVPDKKGQPAHKHDDKIELDPEKKEDPTDAYKHVHDDPEEATFFTQSIRSKLKAALTVMWDAELHLRMFDPEKSLPYQYTALKLLKEISNDSRIYVHKTGFDPPPLKEEKRLTGDLSEITNTSHQVSERDQVLYPHIRAALLIAESRLQHAPGTLNAEDKRAFLRAGQELSGLALERPGDFLEALSRIRSLTEEQTDAQTRRDHLLTVRKAFWKALPNARLSPEQGSQDAHDLEHTFIKKLEALKNE